MVVRRNHSGGNDKERERREVAERLAAMVGGATPAPKPPTIPPVVPRANAVPQRAPVPVLQQWEVRGAFRESGTEATLVIEAPTQAAAEYEASQHGLLVASCWPVRPQVAPLPAEPPPHPLGYGGPLPPAPMPFGQPPPHVLIEQTSKIFKWQMLAGFLLSIFGLFGSCLFAPIAGSIKPGLGVAVIVLGVMCFIGGFVWALVAKFGAWWHHG